MVLGVVANPTAEDPLDGERCDVDPLQTPNVHRPSVERLNALFQLARRGIAGTPKGKDPAHRTEVVLRGLRPPLIERQLLPRREEPQRLPRHPKIERAPATTNRAVAHAHMVDVRVDLEPDAAA